MTSKEALEILRQELYLILPKNIRDNLIDTIKQDLERLEIERQAYKNLKELYDIDTKSLLQENEKLKNAIEILKNKISISVNRTVVWFETEKGCVIFKIDTQQEYELLKEVLGE